MPEDFTPPQQPTPPYTAPQQAAQHPPNAAYGPPPTPPPPGYAYAPSPYGPSPYAAYPPPGYPQQPPRRSGWFWAMITVGIVAVVIIVFCVFVSSMAKSLGGAEATSTLGQDSIAVVDVSGVITDADKIEKPLRKFAADSNVKAIILHIDSPGGGAAVSQEVYHEVLRVKAESHKPIIASVESVGASGAYYIASACDKIYANPASVVGSIGVIMEWTNYGDLMRWAKLKPVVIAHGELKDAGDPTRDVTPKEQAYFQSLVDNMYAQFVHDVATGRHAPDNKIEPLATGQVWTGEQSLNLGLIDTLGGYRIALLDTAKQVGISGEPHVVKPEREKHGLAALISGDQTTDDLFPNPSKLLNRAPGFYFLWR